MTEEYVSVVGAGLVGALTAIALVERDIPVRVFERRARDELWQAESDVAQTEDLRNRYKETGKAGRRSINLALSFRGQEALRSVGLLDRAKKLCVPMHGRAIHLLDTKDQVEEAESGFLADQIQPYDEVDAANFNNSISRDLLNDLLLKRLYELKKTGKKIEIFFDHAFVSLDRDMTLCFLSANEEIKFKSLAVIGCDGSGSGIRDFLSKYNFSFFQRNYIEHGYKELLILPKETEETGETDETSETQLKEREFLHIWPRGDKMLIALPNLDKSFTVTLFAPLTGKQGLLGLTYDKKIEDFFEEHFAEIKTLIPDYLEQFKENPTSRLVEIKLDNWFFSSPNGPALVIGDAAHAMVPFYGQGMNCGFEDVLELSLEIDKELSKESASNLKEKLSRSFESFSRRRTPAAQACCQLSFNNYAEMRSHTASSLFLMKKKLEGVLNRILGTMFIPLYKMVSFTRIPYDEVIRKDQKQQRVLKISTYTALFLVVCGFSAFLWNESNKIQSSRIVNLEVHREV